MKKILILIGILSILLLTFPQIVKSESIIYDNITTSQYKILKIKDDINIKYINDYEYTIFLDGNYYGKFKKDENILIPDNSNVVIHLNENIKYDVSNAYDIVKPSLIIIVGFFLSFGIFFIALYVLYKKFKR